MSLHRIVAVSRNPEVQQLAQEYGQEVFGADDLVDALDIVQTVNPDLILFDHHFDPGHIREFVLRRSDTAKNDTLQGDRFAASAAPIVVLGNNDSNTDLSADFIQAGAYDYLPKDSVNQKSISRVIMSTFERVRLKREESDAQNKMAKCLLVTN